MSKELVSGDYCYVGNPIAKEKRIWLGCLNGLHLCVHSPSEEEFKNSQHYDIITYRTCTPIGDEPKYYYIWEKLDDGYMRITGPATNEYAEREELKENGWVRNDSTKRLPLGVSSKD